MTDPEYVPHPATLSDGTPNPYYVEQGGKSIMHGIWQISASAWREARLEQPIRAATLDWLATALAAASGRSLVHARTELCAAIPEGAEDMLDGGDDFLCAVYVAAAELGCDIEKVDFTFGLLDS